MKPRTILDGHQLNLTIARLCQQLIENHKGFDDTAILGLQPRGIHFAEKLQKKLEELGHRPQFGKLDITFYRDDFRRGKEILSANATDIDFSLEGKRIVLVDDVLYTGRTVRSAMDAILDFGRPTSVELCVLIDRRLSRHVPIQANYVGQTVDVIDDEKVKVEWSSGQNENKVILLKTSEE